MGLANKNENINLLPKDKSKEAILLKMREKLAGVSQYEMKTELKRQNRVSRRNIYWGWKVAIALTFLVANILFFGPEIEAMQSKVVHKLPTLESPQPTLTIDQQALYWGYALYDFEALKKQFHVPKNVAIDGNIAKKNLAELLPKTGKGTRYALSVYLPELRKTL